MKIMIYDDDKYEAEFLSELCSQYRDTLHIKAKDFDRYHIKKGLRNDDGTGVMAGITQVCSVDGYYIEDGERVPRDGRLTYRGVNIYDLVGACVSEDRFGFEELTFLLLFGFLPTGTQLNHFRSVLSHYRELPAAFTEDVIMKAPSPSVMNRMQSAVAALYAYDPNPDELTPENVLRQSIQIIGRLPSLMTYSYQVKRRNYLNKSMYIHPLKPEQSTAESILNSIRSDRKFTDEEAKLLDLCMMLHAEHGGGNCSTFAVRTLTSAGTDTYSAIAAGIGALKGPKHGGANMKVAEMVDAIRKEVSDITDEGQVADALRKVVRKEIGDGTGLIYGMGHAVYTLSDPRAVLLKENARSLAEKTGYGDEWKLLDCIERLTPEIFLEEKGNDKKMCANVDLYSGLIYRMLALPEDLYTPIFACARAAGWCAHRMEEILTGGRIMRPAYKSLSQKQKYIVIDER